MTTQVTRQHSAHMLLNKRRVCGSLSLALLLLVLLSYSGAQELGSLVVSDSEHRAHVFPTPDEALRLQQSAPSGVQVTYHGGRVMLSPDVYAIFWLPQSGKLQDGTPTSMSPKYQPLLKTFLAQYAGHAISDNNTQYYQVINGATQYIDDLTPLTGVYVDTREYPSSGCTDPITGTNCLSDTQIQNEVGHALELNGWSFGGYGNVYLLFTSSGEGSCVGGLCAYSYYCGYHNYFPYEGENFIYANIPYADPNYCQIRGTPSPNNDAAADAAANSASHELTEAITDPIPDTAWYVTSTGAEIGDLCAWLYSSNTWDNGQANQMWGGVFFELQTEYDNHLGGCVQVGP